MSQIEKHLASISRSLYLISKSELGVKENPYSELPVLAHDERVGKFVCYHQPDDMLYFYENGKYINRIRFDEYVRKCHEEGRLYEASLKREDYIWR